MPLSELQPVKPSRPLVLVVRWAPTSSIDYHPSSACDVYSITNPTSFLAYIQSLVEASQDVTVVIVFSALAELMHILRALSSFRSDSAKYRSIYERNCRDHLKALSPGEPEAPVVMAEGQYDLPLALSLAIVIDPADLGDHLVAKSVVLQQYLRLIALKHGASVLSLDNLPAVLKAPHKLLRFNPPPKPIYDTSDLVDKNGVGVILHIPSGWDTWAKIILLARSAVFQDNSQVLLDDKSLREASKTYDDFFEGSGSPEPLVEKIHGKSKVVETAKQSSPLSLNDMLVQAST